MSKTLLTVNDNGTLLCHDEDTLDEWFRSLPAAEKVRIYIIELEAPAIAGALYDEVRNSPLRITEANGPVQPGARELTAARRVPGAVHGQEGEVDGQVVDFAEWAEAGGHGNGRGSAAAGHGGRLPNPVVDVAGPQVIVWDPWARHNHRIALADACRLVDESVIVETTSYSDDHFDGSDAVQYFEVIDAVAFAREVAA